MDHKIQTRAHEKGNPFQKPELSNQSLGDGDMYVVKYVSRVRFNLDKL